MNMHDEEILAENRIELWNLMAQAKEGIKKLIEEGPQADADIYLIRAALGAVLIEIIHRENTKS